MSLCHCPLVYVFLETVDVATQRASLESNIGLPVIEVEEDPSAKHGVVKYDAGTLLVGLNVAPARRFAKPGGDGLVIVFGGRDRDPLTDRHGHHYAFRPAEHSRPVVAELRLAVTDPAAAGGFYRDVLGLTPLAASGRTASFEAGTVTLVLERAPGDAGGRARRDTYLLVFHTRDIRQARAALAAHGLVFSGRRVGSRSFGDTIFFTDPAGHRFCLYEPSAEALATPSGTLLQKILAGCDYALPIALR